MVVIGAGIGGLAAALEIAHRGAEVVVCEAAPVPGGKAREVTVGDRAIAAGPTVFTMPWVFEALFDAVGERLSDHLRLTRAETLARHAWEDGSRLDLFADPARSEAAIKAFAGPADAAAFRRFRARAARLFAALNPVFIEAEKPTPLGAARAIGARPDVLRDMGAGSLAGALRATFRDPRLRQLFGRYATYVGGSPYRAPALLALIWHVEEAGVFLVEGGIPALAAKLAGLVKARGGEIRTGTPVAEILVRGGRAAGVRLDSGEEIPARAVVFNGDQAALSAGLLGAAARPATRPVPAKARGLSALTLTGLFRAEGFPLHHHTVFFSSDYGREFREILRDRRLPSTPTTYLCAQDRGADGGLSPSAAGAERLLAIINAPADGDLYALPQEEIDRCQTNALDLLARCGLQLTSPDGAVIATSPAALARSYPGTGGSLYGTAPHGWMASFRRPGARSRLPGLYLAGGSVHPGAGVPMAALSGRLAARAWAEDRASTAPCRRAATDGGISTRSATTAPTR